MARTLWVVVLLVGIVVSLTPAAELWAAEPVVLPGGWSAMSQYGALSAPACGSPNGLFGYGACCPTTSHCCDNAWACYCEWKAKWHQVWSRVGQPPGGYCGICGARGCRHMAYAFYPSAYPGDGVIVPESMAPVPTEAPSADEQLQPVPQAAPVPQPAPIPQPTPAPPPSAPVPPESAPVEPQAAPAPPQSASDPRLQPLPLVPTPPLPGPGLPEPLEPADPAQSPQAPQASEAVPPLESPAPPSSSAQPGTDATPTSGGSLLRRLLPWVHNSRE